MSVLVEVFSIIIKRDIVQLRYPGGVDAYRLDCPTNTFCSDGILTRIGFMTLSDTEQYAAHLLDMGVLPKDDIALQEFAIMDQFDGHLTQSYWLNFARHPDGYSMCWPAGADPGQLAVPEGWNAAQSKSFRKPGDTAGPASKVQYLRTDGRVAVFVDRETGKELYVGMPDLPDLVED